jgi:TatD DNase family protein
VASTQPARGLRLYDAHNHLQDERLAPYSEAIWSCLATEPIQGMVVNGSAERDWDAVLKLAQAHKQVIPSFGYHPWYAKERSPEWLQVLTRFLDQVPSAVGEIGLDRWIKDHDVADQEKVFCAQLQLAAERDLPVTIHCLQAWGRLSELLRSNPRPECGFVLHSYGGPAEMVEPLAKLGAYFSLPGYFADERKTRQRETFRHVPADRLLIETDAPDQPLPDERVMYPLPEERPGKPLNHPGNLKAVYQFAAELLDQPLETLARTVEQNFCRIFGPLMREMSG